MSSIAQYLADWKKAGLITEAIYLSIIKYESDKEQTALQRGEPVEVSAPAAPPPSRFGSAMLSLGALAIFLGFAAVIGSNWAAIPASVKLIVHFLINAGLAGGIFWAHKNDKERALEIMVFLLAGFTLTFIALIGQIYQTGAPLWKAMLLWLGLTTPFVFALARAKFTMLCWAASAIFTLATCYPSLSKALGDWTPGFFMALFFFVFGLCQTKSLRVLWGDWPVVLTTFGCLFMAAAASIAQLAWHGWGSHLPTDKSFGVALLFGVAGSLIVAMFRSNDMMERKNAPLDLFAFVSVLFICLPPLLAPEHHVSGQIFISSILPAFLFMSYWVFCGWIGTRIQHYEVLRLAVLLISIRLLVIYIELFGGLLSTGIGLIVSGLLLIGLVYWVRRIIALLPQKRSLG